MKAFLGFLLLALVPATPGRADGVESGWWRAMVGAERAKGSLLPQVDRLTGLDLVEACRPMTQALLQDLGQYAGLAANRKSKAAGRIPLLRKISAKDPCFEQAVRAYFLGSVFVSQPGFFLEGDRAVFEGSLTNHPSMRIFLEAAALLKGGYIQFLTAPRRAELAGHWADPDLLGAYDCLSSVIFVDPRLRPFDLGATFVHELDHLMRDKVYSAALFHSEFLPRLSSEEAAWEAFLLADESFASVASAFAQRVNRSSAFLQTVTTKSFFGKTTVKRQVDVFRAKDDLSFINTGGPLEALFQTSGDWLSHFPVESLFTISGRFQEDRKAFPGILAVVHEGYFGGALAPEISPLISSSVFDPALDSLLAFPADKDYYKGALAAFDYWALQHEILGGNSSYGISAEDYATVGALVSHMPETSPVCELYASALERGLAPDYLGRRYGSGRPGEHGTRPGEQGVRPSVAVRPCVHLKKL